MKKQRQLQIGKNGLTPAIIDQLNLFFRDTESIRVSLLSSATRDKEEAKKIALTILDALGKNYTCKVIGYTLILHKWKKPMRE